MVGGRKCKECKHYKRTIIMKLCYMKAKCTSLLKPGVIYSHYTCKEQRSNNEAYYFCGKKGKFFERR